MNGATSWFGPGTADFFAIYDAEYDRIQEATMEAAVGHPEFGPIVRAMPPDLLEAQNRESRERLKRAMAGDWEPYEVDLRVQGTTYARMGISFRGWSDLVSGYSRVVTPLLVERYGAQSARLSQALLAMQAFLDRVMCTLAEAYLETKQALVRARERDLEVTLDSIGDAVIATDAQGRVVRMNPVAERLTGWSRHEARGRALSEVFVIENEETGAPAESPVDSVLRDGAVVGLANHTALVARDGRRVPIADSAAPIVNDEGEVAGVVMVFRDVADARAAERELRASEARKSAMIGGAIDCIVCIDAAGAITEFNPAAERTFGHAREEVLGKSLAEVLVPERHRDAHRRGLARYVETGQAHVLGRRIELPAICADGRELPVELAIVPIGSRQEPAFAGFIRDLSAQRRNEEMRARSIELEAENRRVLEASRMKSEFLANMSHELRTPLNSILGFAELLHDEEVGPVGAQQKEFLGDILTSGRHLLSLINDVLDLSKVEAGRMEFHPERVEMEAIIAEVCAVLRGMASTKRIEVEREVDAAVRYVEVDAARIKQILYNYLSNALKFTPDGGRVKVRALAEGTHGFRLEVEDDGSGIAGEDLGRLFVEFQQLDAGRAKRHQGTGLGLALTRRLAEAMGGAVGVKSTPGERTVFHAVLPLRAAGTSALPTRRRLSQVAPGVPVVLVVEDEPEDQELIVRTLTASGYAVETASTMAQALVLSRQRAYDAITLDLVLPDGSGLEVLRALRADGPNRNAPVVVITLVTDRAVSGYVVDDVLPKPFEPTALLATLQRVGASQCGSDVLVIDDDASSLRLMSATLEQLGFRAACFRDAETALEAVPRLRPRAVVLDLVMPRMDGFRFLQLFRQVPGHGSTPVLVWTVRDLAGAELAELHGAAQGFLPKGSTQGASLTEALREHLAARAVSAMDGG